MTEQTRERWAGPYTLRERMTIRYDLKRYDVRRFFEDGIWQRLAWILPRKLVLWAFIRAAGYAWTTTKKPPDELNYQVVYEAWEAKRQKRKESCRE